MTSVLDVRRMEKDEDKFCDICTARATVHVVIGKLYVHSLNAMQVWLCDECADKLGAKLITEAKS